MATVIWMRPAGPWPFLSSSPLQTCLVHGCMTAVEEGVASVKSETVNLAGKHVPRLPSNRDSPSTRLGDSIKLWRQNQAPWIATAPRRFTASFARTPHASSLPLVGRGQSPLPFQLGRLSDLLHVPPRQDPLLVVSPHFSNSPCDDETCR
jgi:hypothetical protein